MSLPLRGIGGQAKATGDPEQTHPMATEALARRNQQWLDAHSVRLLLLR
ncbi:hypothetical protein O77CONTIG1_04290 [Leptolyngbya sp. O-77]|nr:hypothetical protein O77CONTIG1_04290 [Leptolyngbya sp. O-77]